MEAFCNVHNVPQAIIHATVPVYGADHDYPLIQDRTGVLVEWNGSYFLLTAVHEFSRWFDMQSLRLNQGASLFVSTGDQVHHNSHQRGPETVPIVITRAEFFDEDKIDIAIFELHPSILKQLPANRFFKLQHSFGYVPSAHSEYFVLGHPLFLHNPGDAEEADPLVSSPRCCFGTVMNKALQMPVNGHLHELCLDMPESLQTYFTEKEVDEGVKGMSGCGIWCFDKGHGDEVHLVGIQHRQGSHFNYILGSAINHAVTFFKANY